MSEPRRMLVVAPHPDDEILGAGGTIARFTRAGGEVTVLTVAAHMPPLYTDEVHKKTVNEARKAHAIVGVKESIFLDNPAVLLGAIPVHELNAKILAAVERVRPHLLLVPFYDRHVDHRHVFDAAMVAARPVGPGKSIGVVAAYETLSETHWNAPHIEPNFTPNWCVDISSVIEQKLEALRSYESQLSEYPAPRSLEAVRALAVFRGTQAGCAHGECFHVIRLNAGPENFAWSAV